MYECDMARKIHEMVAELGADLGSPKVVDAINSAITALINLRKVAVNLHGEPGAGSNTPPIALKTDAIAQPRPTNGSSGFDGRVKSLADLYFADQSFLGNRYKTRKTYGALVKYIIDDCGDENIAHWKMQDVQRQYDSWVKKRSKSMARALIVMLRTLIYFGATVLHDSECERLSVILHRMRFPIIKSRTERLSVVQANTIRAEAHKMDRASIALAQAFQFDCKLRQVDVIGEWVPESEPQQSYVKDAGSKWLRGLRWEEIDDNLILTHMTSKSQAETAIDLKKQAPMVIEELRLKFGTLARDKMPATGPIIVNETTDWPWQTFEFRRYWRKAADKAGVPRSVRNADSSSGATREDAKARAAAAGEKDIDLLEVKSATSH